MLVNSNTGEFGNFFTVGFHGPVCFVGGRGDCFTVLGMKCFHGEEA